MLPNSAEYKKTTQNWMVLIEESIYALRDLFKADVKEAINEALVEKASKAAPLVREIENTDFLTIDQAVELLHVSKPTFHRYRKERGLVISRVGRRVLIKKSDLEAIIQVKPKIKGGAKI